MPAWRLTPIERDGSVAKQAALSPCPAQEEDRAGAVSMLDVLSGDAQRVFVTIVKLRKSRRIAVLPRGVANVDAPPTLRRTVGYELARGDELLSMAPDGWGIARADSWVERRRDARESR